MVPVRTVKSTGQALQRKNPSLRVVMRSPDLQAGHLTPVGHKRDSRYFLAASASGNNLKSWKVLMVLRLINMSFYRKPNPLSILCIPFEGVKYIIPENTSGIGT